MKYNILFTTEICSFRIFSLPLQKQFCLPDGIARCLAAQNETSFPAPRHLPKCTGLFRYILLCIFMPSILIIEHYIVFAFFRTFVILSPNKAAAFE